VHRRNFEPLAAGLADDLIVDANEMIPQLGKLRPIALIRARRQPILLGSPDPPYRVLVRSPAPWTAEALFASFRLVEEEGAFV
jgi:hypothetical protein